jgi:hypothetical protein
MTTEQLLEMPAVRTDHFSLTGFASYTIQGTEIKKFTK